MSWALVGGAAITVASSYMQQDAARSKALRETSQANAERAEVNLKNAVRAGYRQGLLNIQAGQYKKAAAQQGFDASAAKLNALSQANLNAAASGSVGASVDAVNTDIEMRMGEYEAKQSEVRAATAFNLDLQSRELQFGLEQGSLSMLTADVPDENDMWTNAAIAGTTQAGSQYLSNRPRTK